MTNSTRLLVVQALLLWSAGTAATAANWPQWLVILLCDHQSASYLLALDARTGGLRWKADRGKGRASYSTPLVVPGPAGDELVVNSSERIDGYDPARHRDASLENLR